MGNGAVFTDNMKKACKIIEWQVVLPTGFVNEKYGNSELQSCNPEV